MNYEQNYLKYSNLENEEQVGGAFPFDFKNAGKIVIMATIKDDILKGIEQRQKNLGISTNNTIHITLLDIHINFANDDSRIFKTDAFRTIIGDSFINNFKKKDVELLSPQHEYNFFGIKNDIMEKWWVREYTFDRKYLDDIKNFRMDIYKYINAEIEKIQPGDKLEKKIETKPKPPTDFVIYSSQKGELYALHKDHYYIVDNWRPHISIFKIEQIKSSILKYILTELKTVKGKNEIIRRSIKSKGVVVPINIIKMNKILSLLISYEDKPIEGKKPKRKEHNIVV
jgi:hypothetical protein